MRGYVDSSAEALDVVPWKAPGPANVFLFFLITEIAKDYVKGWHIPTSGFIKHPEYT